MATKLKGYDSHYVESSMREYSLYLLEQRALPALTDGLKSTARRLLWTARDGKHIKSANLAGATLTISPHGLPDGTINTLAGKYINNMPLLDGEGAFGTLLSPDAFGASRYTSVEISKFTKDVLFADMDLLPMKDNYDNTLKEPLHFLPLIPICLLNPVDGIAVGFATTILPRKLQDIINDQVSILQGKKIKNRQPHIGWLKQDGIDVEGRWQFNGEFKHDKTKLHVTGLPYGVTHSSFIKLLNKFVDDGTIKDYKDDSSESIDILIKVNSSGVSFNKLKLINLITENINVIDFDHKRVRSLDYKTIVEDFTAWRLKWYPVRIKKEINEFLDELQRYEDIENAFKNNMHKKINTFEDRAGLIAWLKGINVVNLDYIASLPMYRFTEKEIEANRKKISELEQLVLKLDRTLKDENAVKQLYISELKYTLSKHG